MPWCHARELCPVNTLYTLCSYGSGEHTGFALGDSIEGPFKISGNLSWEYGNDEGGVLRAPSLAVALCNGASQAWSQASLHLVFGVAAVTSATHARDDMCPS